MQLPGKMLLGIFALLSLSSLCSGYKILMMCSLPSRSHYNLCRGVVDVLQERGHDITLISAYKADKPKFRDVYVPTILATMDNNFSGFAMVNMTTYQLLQMLNGLVPMVSKAVFNDEGVQNMLNDKSEKFDAFVLEYFINDALIGFALKYDCPAIALSPVSLMSWLAVLTDNPLAIPTVPNVFTTFSAEMTLGQRVVNTLMAAMQYAMGTFLFERTQENVYKQYFPKEAEKVPYSELKDKIASTLVNSHPSIGVVRPLLPNTIEVGGYHIKDPEPLPADIQGILDSAKDGVIFFSMGSNLKSSEMSNELRDTLLKGFASLKETVIWKFEKDIPNKPKNVIIRSWLPQTGILNHPKVKLFITHGGLLSCTEATHFGIPLLAIPVFGDQFHNAKEIAIRGQGVHLDFLNITDVSLNWALNEVLSNKKYTQNAKNLHQLYHDRPIKPRQHLGFHVEHVIRTKGAKHLNPPRLPGYSLFLLDVALVLLIPALLITYLFTLCCRKCCGSKKSGVKNQKKLKQK